MLPRLKFIQAAEIYNYVYFYIAYHNVAKNFIIKFIIFTSEKVKKL